MFPTKSTLVVSSKEENNGIMYCRSNNKAVKDNTVHVYKIDPRPCISKRKNFSVAKLIEYCNRHTYTLLFMLISY